MRQRRDGKRVQNWHRPMRRDQLSRRYVNRRHDTPGIVEQGRPNPDPDREDRSAEDLAHIANGDWEFLEYHGLADADEIWDPRNAAAEWPFGICHFRGVKNRVRDAAVRAFVAFHRDVVAPRPAPLFPPPSTAGRTQDGDTLPGASPAARSDLTPVEHRLARFVTMLVHLPEERHALERLVDDAIGDRRNVAAVQAATTWRGKRTDASVDLAKTMFLFSPFWVREPRAAEGTDARGMIRHAFMTYDVPEFLLERLFRREGEEQGLHPWSHHPDHWDHLKWFCWLVLLGQGGSLARAAPLLGWNIPGRFQHFLTNLELPSLCDPVERAPWNRVRLNCEVTGGISPVEACCVAELRRLGADDRDLRRILGHGAFLIDPTEESAEPSYPRFWQATARWMIAHRDAMTNDEAAGILDWAMHEYTEGVRAGGAEFSWKGRGVGPTLARSLAYARHLARPWLSYRWKGHGWDFVDQTDPAGPWSFVELTSGEDLFLEGRALHHCVAGYAGRCAAGRSAIVSMRHDGARVVTIEVVPDTGRIIQARGACNRPATGIERQAIDRWADAVLRRIS